MKEQIAEDGEWMKWLSDTVVTFLCAGIVVIIIVGVIVVLLEVY